MPSDDTDPAPRTANPRHTRRPIYWFLIVCSALLVGGIAGLVLWYVNAPAADRLTELSPRSTWDWTALIITGVILIAMASALTWITVSAIRLAHKVENER